MKMRRDIQREFVKMRIKKLTKSKYFKLLLLLIAWLAYVMSRRITSSQETVPPVNLKYVVVHLDFKRTPINLDYVQGLLHMLKKLGANGLLMEYEDMFPFEGNLANLSAPNCYSKYELQSFLSKAKNLGFEVIPLVQTFGHMEYALKLKKFAHLREHKDHPDSICPSKAASLALIKDMLKQMISFHNSIATLKYIHIGCDEVFHMAKCLDCRKRKISTQQIYLNHVNSIYGMVKVLSKGTTVLLWDDMLRTISPAKWRYDFQYTPIEPVYWMYMPKFNVYHSSLLNYHRTFSNIWIATAYKGADGPTSVLPDVKNRFLNHYTWLNIIKNYKFGGEKHVYNFKGIILTGWSRYDHNKPPCDLLPASIPSLFANLILIQEFKSGEIDKNDVTNPIMLYEKYIYQKMQETLECEDVEIEFDKLDEKRVFDNLYLDECNFEGAMLYETLKVFLRLNSSIVFGANATKVSGMLSKLDWCDYMSNSIKYVKKDMTKNMNKYYEKTFVDDYVFEKMFAIKIGLKYCYD